MTISTDPLPKKIETSLKLNFNACNKKMVGMLFFEIQFLCRWVSNDPGFFFYSDLNGPKSPRTSVTASAQTTRKRNNAARQQSPKKMAQQMLLTSSRIPLMQLQPWLQLQRLRIRSASFWKRSRGSWQPRTAEPPSGTPVAAATATSAAAVAPRITLPEEKRERGQGGKL